MNEISKVVVVFRPERLNIFKAALKEAGILGMTVTAVEGCGLQGGRIEHYRGSEILVDLLPKTKVELIVPSEDVQTIIDIVKKVLKTGKMGDGKIFVSDVKQVVRISNESEGLDALDLNYNK